MTERPPTDREPAAPGADREPAAPGADREPAAAVPDREKAAAAASDREQECAEATRLTALLVALVDRHNAVTERCAGECGLSAAQAEALLRIGDAVSMRELADRLGCHASNVTGTIDRLAGRGLVERYEDALDRRIKRLALTPRGAALRADLEGRLRAAPNPYRRLAPGQRRQLRALLERALGLPRTAQTATGAGPAATTAAGVSSG